MEQQPPDRPLLFHARLASSLLILCVACGGMVWHAITAVLEKGKPNMMVRPPPQLPSPLSPDRTFYHAWNLR